jgi:hypothetical protein
MRFERHFRTARLPRLPAVAGQSAAVLATTHSRNPHPVEKAGLRGIFPSARFSAANCPHVDAEPSTRSAVRVLSLPAAAGESSFGGRVEGSLWPLSASIDDTSSCNTQLQLAAFPRSVDYRGLKWHLSPFRINTSKNLCTFCISLISGHLKSPIINTSKIFDFKPPIISTSKKTGGGGSSCNSGTDRADP